MRPKEEYPDNPLWDGYYNFLEAIRKDGKINMMGAGKVLEDAFDLNKVEARTILASWMHSYGKIKLRLGWKD